MPSKTIIAMACITAIVIVCIFKDINGALIGTCVAIIAALGGYVFGLRRRP